MQGQDEAKVLPVHSTLSISTPSHPDNDIFHQLSPVLPVLSLCLFPIFPQSHLVSPPSHLSTPPVHLRGSITGGVYYSGVSQAGLTLGSITEHGTTRRTLHTTSSTPRKLSESPVTPPAH
ncbi:hypothetical protein E2C01_091831 [Portunus trituberculatus]|uniref:Uncharacterized protein n=1 Tax=Portunus trituberculatus TaxID=210409 RepID=A0A5B7JTX5_PORTR|nr:hypothetical protein [Portunus trituberculatus]